VTDDQAHRDAVLTYLEDGAALSPSRYAGEFAERFGIPMPVRPANPGPRLAQARQQALEQAVEELRRATDPWDYPSATVPAVDVAAVARELADVVLAAFVTAAVYGIDLDRVLAEVHRASLTQRHADAHGHVRQGSAYTPPDVAAVLAGQHDGSHPSDRAWWTAQIREVLGEGPSALDDLADAWLDEPNDDLTGWTPWAMATAGYGPLLWRHLASLRDARDEADQGDDQL
jgi:NTP pyrophosphatase (non-canonical NTP hydrolase)